MLIALWLVALAARRESRLPLRLLTVGYTRAARRELLAASTPLP